MGHALDTLDRYKTNPFFLDLMHDELQGRSFIVIGTGVRLAAAISAVCSEALCFDVSEDYIEDMKLVLNNWYQYKDKYPFSMERDFIAKYGLDIPRSEKFDFEKIDRVPTKLETRYQGMFAPEVWFYLDENWALGYLTLAHDWLTDDGKVLLTVYPPCDAGSLDHILVNEIKSLGVNSEGVIQENKLDLDLVNQRVSGGKNYNYLMRKYWLDTFKTLPLHTKEDIAGQCRLTGMKIQRKYDVTGGGMFSFANRDAYIIGKA